MFHTDAVYAVDVSPSGEFIVSGSQDDKAILWRVDPYERVHIFEGQFSGEAVELLRCGGDICELVSHGLCLFDAST